MGPRRPDRRSLRPIQHPKLNAGGISVHTTYLTGMITSTQSHIDYVIEVVRRVAERAADLRGYRITDQPPQLRHFTARFEPIGIIGP